MRINIITITYYIVPNFYLEEKHIGLWHHYISESGKNQWSSSARNLKHGNKFFTFHATPNKIRGESKNALNKNKIPTSYSSLSGALGAKPGSNRESGDDRPQAFHVEASIAFVAEEQLLSSVAGAALLAPHVAVIGSLHDGESRPLHYLRERLELLRRGRVVPARRRGAAVEADETLSRTRRRGGGGWSHGQNRDLEKMWCFCVPQGQKWWSFWEWCLSRGKRREEGEGRGFWVMTWRDSIGCANVSRVWAEELVCHAATIRNGLSFYIVAVWKSNDENTLDGTARSCYNLGGVSLNLEFHRRAEFRIPKGIFR